MGVNFNDEIQKFWLLNTLPNSWKLFCVSLINSDLGGNVTIKYVKSGVLNKKVGRRF